MIIYNRHQQREPIGGHHYPEEGGPVIRGDTFEEVVELLGEYRVRNGIPVRCPKEDVLDYYSREYPYMVTTSEELLHDTTPAEYLRWAHWVRTTWNNPPKQRLVSKEAEHRWKTCMNCPCNQEKDWPMTAEAKELERRAFMLRLGLDIPEELGFCSCHRWDNGVAVFIKDAKDFSLNKDKEQPAECWVKGTNE